jgi:hypothetical protein
MEPGLFWIELDRLQPSQLYISTEKLSRVREAFDPARPGSLEPIPLKELDGRVIYTDGHTRAFAAWAARWKEIPAYWDRDELDWEAYRICVGWCLEAGIRTIADLQDRVLSPAEYEVLWYRRCADMQETLRRRRTGEGARA